MNTRQLMLIAGFSAFSAGGAFAATVGQWTFDETSGDTFLDSSGNNRNLTATNPQPLGSGWHRDTDQPAIAPVGGRSLNADSPRVIESASSDVYSLGKTDSLTIEFWYKDTPDASQVVDYIINNNSTGNNRYAVFLDGGDRINFFFIDNAGGTHFLLTPAGSITEAAGWQHIAGVFDTTVGNGSAALYINGSVVASTNSFGGSTLWDSLSANLRVMTQQGAGSGFDGDNLIDELRISNVALPAGNGTGVGELAWNASLVPEPTSTTAILGVTLSGLIRRRR